MRDYIRESPRIPILPQPRITTRAHHLPSGALSRVQIARECIMLDAMTSLMISQLRAD